MKRASIVVLPLVLGLGLGTLVTGQFSQGQVVTAPGPMPKEVTSFREVVKAVLPAVVSIETRTQVVKAKAKLPKMPNFPDNQVPEEFRRFFEEFGHAPDFNDVPQHGLGSGFFVDPAGIILTNYHVVDGAEQVTVTLQDGRKFNSHKIRGDRRTDLAVIFLDQKGPFPALALADSNKAEIGDRVLAVGAPFGLTGSVTAGIISAKGRNGLNMNMYENFLQTDAAINPGNSGGPLVNLEGQVVGINAAIKSRSGGFQGVGLAIASNLAKHVVQSLRSDGVVHRGYLGVQIRDLDPEVAARLNVPKDSGVVVARVFDKTPASKAKIQPGDIITTIDGNKVKDGKVLQGIVADLPLKKAVDIHLIHDGKELTVPVTIEEQPNDFGTASAPAPRQQPTTAPTIPLVKFGIEVADLNDSTAEDLGYHAGTHGVYIAKVDPGSAASEAGLRKGMLIAKVDNHKVTTAAQTQQALQTASLERGVLLQVQSPQGGTTYVLLKNIESGSAK